MKKSKIKLCTLEYKEMDKNDFEHFLKLVRKPGYICRKCARSARSKKNLCHPEKLK